MHACLHGQMCVDDGKCGRPRFVSRIIFNRSSTLPIDPASLSQAESSLTGLILLEPAYSGDPLSQPLGAGITDGSPHLPGTSVVLEIKILVLTFA